MIFSDCLGQAIAVQIGASGWAKTQVDEGGLWHSVGDSPPYRVQEISFKYVEEFDPRLISYENGRKLPIIMELI